jgi:hypothetical protein
MKASSKDIGNTYNVRLYNYKSIRHYGGRDIATTPVTCLATLVGIQDGHQPYVVALNYDCDGYKAGRKIAISDNDFNI